MKRLIRYQNALPDQKLEMSLFPFLSIFLCTMGVLSFINVLSSFSVPQKIELTTEINQGYKVAYQLFTLPDGLISFPPVERLKGLRNHVSGIEQTFLDSIIEKREASINALKLFKGEIARFATPPNIDDILQMTQDIRLINEIALKANYLYEEFILFGIYPNGGEAYQKIRDVMTFTQDYASISIGLEPLDSNWTLNLSRQNTPNGNQQ